MNLKDSEHDQVGAYVLDALSDGERASFEAHLAGCEACQAEVAELRQVVDVLPLSLELEEPPPSLKDRLMAAVEAESDGAPALVAIPGGRPTPRQRTPWRLPEILGVVAAAVLIVGLGLWNVHLQRQIDQDRSALAYQRQVASAIASHASVSPISAVGVSRASAALVQPRNKRPAYLIVQGLPPTPSNRVYELWLIRGKSQPQPAKVFSYGGSGPQIEVLPMSARGYTVAAVTVERGPHGTKVPAGPQVLAGKLQA